MYNTCYLLKMKQLINYVQHMLSTEDEAIDKTMYNTCYLLKMRQLINYVQHMLSTEDEAIDKLCTTHAIYWRWGNW